MYKVASRADSWYNRRVKNVLPQRCWKHPVAWIASDWRCIMDILYPHAQDGNTSPEKTCTGPCGRTLPATIEFFHRCKGGKYGLRAKCRVCQSEVNKIHNRENYRRNAGKRRAYAVQYRQEHPEQVQAYREAHRQEHRQYDVAYHAEHREERNAYRRQYNRDHHDRLHEYSLWYRQTERARITARVTMHKRRAQKRNSQGSHTAKELREQLQRQKNKCYYCHNKLVKARNGWQADHIVPLSKGGSDSIDNIVIACPDCNNSKHARLLHEWDGGGRLL